MARGVDGRPIFLEDKDRYIFIDKFRHITAQHSARILAYCLMDNHFHFAIKVHTIPLSRIMHRILTGYSAAFNHHRHRTGHLFQARYKACLCRDDSYLIALIRYIHQNPVRAGLVEHAEQWKWSSSPEYAQQGKNGGIEYESDLPDLPEFDPWPSAREIATPNLLRTESASLLSLEELAAKISDEFGVRPQELRCPGSLHRVVAIKRAFVRSAVSHGWSINDVAAWLRRSKSSISRYASEKLHKVGSLTPSSDYRGFVGLAR